MKKFLLVLFIIICGTFIYFKVQTLGAENSNFNQTTRYQLGKHSLLRIILGLHKDGDGRGWFFSGSGPINIEIVQAGGTNLDDTALSQFAGKVEKYTGRPAVVFNNDDNIKGGTLSESDLADVVAAHRRHANTGYPSLFVIYAEDFIPGASSEELGRTYQEYGIVVSDAKIKSLTAQYPAAFQQYAESTLLHEFGHQLGLDHNQDPNCVMDSKVEGPSFGGSFTGNFTPTDFCPAELDQLAAIKAQYK